MIGILQKPDAGQALKFTGKGGLYRSGDKKEDFQ